MRKIIAAMITIAVLFTFMLPTYAAATPSPKEEVVYGILALDGSVTSVYVVNIFDGGEIVDYGDYREIRNLTTSEKLSNQNGQITATTTAEKLYYKGTLKSQELPWKIVVKYFLNGIELAGSELAGQDGALQIVVAVSRNPLVNSTFFEHYALQITLALDTKRCSNIQAEQATIAEAGSKKQLNYTLLPGKEAEIRVSADVHDFVMDAITINGIKLSLNIAFDQTELTGQFSQLSEAIKGLDDGSLQLLAGVNQLSLGLEQYFTGMKSYKDGLAELDNGMAGLNAGAGALQKGLSELSMQNDSLVQGALAIQQAAFDTVNQQLAGMGLALPLLTAQNYKAVLANLPDLALIQAQLDAAVQFAAGLKNYTDGVAQLAVGAGNLASGTSQLKTAAAKAASGADQLYQAGVQLNAAVKQLQEGLAAYQNGTSQLKNQTSNMAAETSSRINAMIAALTGSGGETVSFVSEQNTNISAVQFVLKTEAIKLKDTAPAVIQQPAVLTFWQKLLKLFGLYP